MNTQNACHTMSDTLHNNYSTSTDDWLDGNQRGINLLGELSHCLMWILVRVRINVGTDASSGHIQRQSHYRHSTRQRSKLRPVRTSRVHRPDGRAPCRNKRCHAMHFWLSGVQAAGSTQHGRSAGPKLFNFSALYLLWVWVQICIHTSVRTVRMHG